jgi:hypothetical protein
MFIAVILSKAKNLKAMRPFANAQGDNFLKSFTIKALPDKTPNIPYPMKSIYLRINFKVILQYTCRYGSGSV